MRVYELIELLSQQDPEANVTFASQPSWPFEFSIQGIAVRRDVEGDATRCPACGGTDTRASYDYGSDPTRRWCNDCEGMYVLENEEESFGEHNLNAYGDDKRKSGGDVILVEGSQLSYASKDIWDNVIYP